MKFEKVTNPRDYRSASCKDHFEIAYSELVEKLGEPFKNGDAGFPDDDDKVDVCWCFTFEGSYVPSGTIKTVQLTVVTKLNRWKTLTISVSVTQTTTH